MDRSLRGLINNKNGSLFESEIIGGCMAYNLQERAFIEKTPEPFKVSKPLENGFFKGRFTSKSQPDFKGTLRNGLSIVFEAKYTSTDKIRADVLTENQMECLEKHYKLGAITGVVIGIQDQFFFVPWKLWRLVYEQYRRQYLRPEDIQAYRVKFNGNVNFLDLKNGGKVERIEEYRREN